MSEMETLAQTIAASARTSDAAHWPEAAANSVLSAGYSKARSVERLEDLDSLAPGSAVLDRWNNPAVKQEDEGCTWWWYPGDQRCCPSRSISLPATIIWEHK